MEEMMCNDSVKNNYICTLSVTRCLQGKMLLRNACILTMNTAQTFINLISQGIKTDEDLRK